MNRIEVSPDGRTLAIIWDDQHRSEFDALWLFDNLQLILRQPDLVPGLRNADRPRACVQAFVNNGLLAAGCRPWEGKS